MKKVFLFLIMILALPMWAENYIKIDLTNRKFIAVKDGAVVRVGGVLGGRKGHATPAGTFKVYLKKRLHRSSKWPKPKGGAKMYYSMFLQNINSGRKTGVALHQGSLKVKSHGCIHLSHDDAKWLFDKFPKGTEVRIYK